MYQRLGHRRAACHAGAKARAMETFGQVTLLLAAAGDRVDHASDLRTRCDSFIDPVQ